MVKLKVKSLNISHDTEELRSDLNLPQLVKLGYAIADAEIVILGCAKRYKL
jgi:hypothetical protein